MCIYNIWEQVRPQAKQIRQIKLKEIINPFPPKEDEEVRYKMLTVLEQSGPQNILNFPQNFI